MYIKQIIIEGFKSYAQRTVVEFDPKHNIIVGENGSGKSSFLLAIQFILSTEFIPLRKKQRLDLLNEKSGLRSASVEIIFDNSDQQLPNANESISVKRVVSVKSDNFFLSGEMISTTDISYFLESAGFSKSNPYYIVKQGKISEYALGSEKRLKLLRELAGTKFYIDNKKVMLMTLDDMQIKIEKIQNYLADIDERESSLKEDIKELKEYKKLDKQHTTVKFIINERIINKNKSRSKELENKSKTLSKSHKKLNDQLQILQEDIKKSNKELTKFKKEIENVKDKKKKLRFEQENLLTEKNKLYLKTAELKENIKNYNEDYQEIDKKLEELNKLIDEKKKHLQRLQFQYENQLIKEEEVKRKLDSAEQTRKELCKKRGRGSQFNSKEERDLWIKEELEQLKSHIKDKEKQKIEVVQEIESDTKKHAELEKKIEELEKKEVGDQRKYKDFQVELYNLKKQRNELLARRKELHKEDKDYTDQLTSLKENVTNLEKKLKSIFGSIVDGKNSVQKVLETFRDNPKMKEELTKYCGLVVENFDCKSALIYKAVEETAGQQLLYHIVETRKFGSEILKEINRQHLRGEFTFIPLDCLEVPVASYPENENAAPLIYQLNYNNKYDKPLRKIFGRTLVCRDLKHATTFAKKYHFDCVTLEGDKATSKGWLKGGHYTSHLSSMEIQKEIIDISEKISLLHTKLNRTKDAMKENDNDMSKCISRQQNLEVKINETRDTFNDIQCKINNMKKELDSIDTLLIAKKNSLKECEVQLAAMDNSQKSLNAELGQNMEENLSIHDQQLLENLNDSISYCTIELRKMYNEKTEKTEKKIKLEQELNAKLIPQKNKLVEIQKKMSFEGKQELLKLSNDELEGKETEIKKNMDDLKKSDGKANTLHEQLKDINSKREKLQLDEKKLLNDIAEYAKQLEKITSRINAIEKTIAVSVEKNSELTVPSNDLYAKFNEKNHEQLRKILDHTSHQLKSYDQINKKALDQFNALNNARKLLYKRKEEIDTAYIKIQELMNALERKKCEAMEFMFRQVSKNFTDIFEKLVPTGNACLVMKTADDTNSQNDTETAIESVEEYDNFIGMDIRASFTRSMATKEINQLSGGQKSLLSLALILAIQKYNPAPVYLFDEIDETLDFDHRESVAKMIHERSETAQFITVTFRPEFLQNANKFHRVTSQNNKSHIRTMTREEAISFLTDHF